MLKGLYKIASIRALALASVFSLFVGPMAQAGGSPTGHGAEWRSGALITDGAQGAKWKPMVKSPENGIRLATDGAPGGPTDDTSDQRPIMLAGSASGAGGDMHAQAELTTDTHMMVAGGRVGGVGDPHAQAELTTDTHMMFAGGKVGATTNPVGDKTSQLTTDTHMMVAGGRVGGGGDVYALVSTDIHSMFAGGRVGGIGDPHAQVSTDTDDQRPIMLAGSASGASGDMHARAELKHAIVVAGSSAGAGGDISRRANLITDTHMMVAGGRVGACSNPIDDAA